MKNIWKWIIGIVVVLVVFAGMVGLAFVMHNRMSINIAQRVAPNLQTWHGPMMDEFRSGERGGPMMRHGKTPMLGGRVFGHAPWPFAPGFMIFGAIGRLIPLAILILLVYVAYLLGKRATTAPAGTAAVVPAPAPTPEPEPLSEVVIQTCKKCGNALEGVWQYCPSCGKKQ